MELSLVCILNKNTRRKQYLAVNDKEYDSMLACGGCWEIEKDYEWDYLGEIEIEDKTLEEAGWKFNESIMD